MSRGLRMIGITITLGELVDRITILEIKSKMIKDETKLIDVRKELQQLRGQYHTHGVEVPEMLKQKLDSLNLTLWQVENDLRRKEVNLEFDEEFVISSLVLIDLNLFFIMKVILKYKK